MYIKTSHYVAEVDGKSVYETSCRVHDDDAWLCWLFDPLGYFIGQYINPVGQYGSVPEDHTLWTYPAKRFMTDKKQKLIKPEFTGGVQE